MRGKPRDGSKNPGGRPKGTTKGIKKTAASPLSMEEQIYELAKVSLCAEEIACLLGFGRNLLFTNESYSTALKRGEHDCNSSLRRKQYQLAMKGDKTMLVWLGKQRLHQRDRHEHSGPDGKPIPVSFEGAQAALEDFLAEIARTAEQREGQVPTGTVQ